MTFHIWISYILWHFTFCDAYYFVTFDEILNFYNFIVHDILHIVIFYILWYLLFCDNSAACPPPGPSTLYSALTLLTDFSSISKEMNSCDPPKGLIPPSQEKRCPHTHTLTNIHLNQSWKMPLYYCGKVWRNIGHNKKPGVIISSKDSPL